LPSLSSLSQKKLDNSKSLAIKKFTRPIESKKVSIETEKLTYTKPKKQPTETLPLEKVTAQAILGKTIKIYISNFLALREINATLIRCLQAL